MSNEPKDVQVGDPGLCSKQDSDEDRAMDVLLSSDSSPDEKTCGALTVDGNVYGRCGKPATVPYSLAEEHAEEPGYYCVSRAAFRFENPFQKKGG
jgi:hypothetical protein